MKFIIFSLNCSSHPLKSLYPLILQYCLSLTFQEIPLKCPIKQVEYTNILLEVLTTSTYQGTDHGILMSQMNSTFESPIFLIPLHFFLL